MRLVDGDAGQGRSARDDHLRAIAIVIAARCDEETQNDTASAVRHAYLDGESVLDGTAPKRRR
jgi:hypothetical protein